MFESSGMVNLKSDSNDNNNKEMLQPYQMISPRNLENELTNPITATIETVSLNTATVSTSDVRAEEQKQQQQKSSFCSLFVIFGLNAASFVKKDDPVESYEVLGSYPNLDECPEVAAEHKFVQDMKMICFPEVRLRAERFHLSRMDPLCRFSFFHFISTSDLGDKKYLTSMHFKEILLSERGAFVIDKAICVASSQPIFTL